MERSVQTDAVVVGAGPNGLAAALTLARQGFRVVVLEAAEEPGGGTRTIPDDSFSGIVHDHCSAVHPFASSSSFFRSLPLERHGLRWQHPEVAVAHPLDDGTAVAAFKDLDATVDALGPDGPAWRRLFGHASKRYDQLAQTLMKPFPRVPRHPVSLARQAPALLAPATVLARGFATERGRALFGGLAAHIIAPLSRVFSSSVGIMMGAAGHAYGWPFAEGGSAAIWKAMASYLDELGVEIHTGVEIDRLDELPRARVALFDVAPGALASILGERLPARQRRRYRRWRHGPAAFKVDYVIDDEVPWTADEARRAGTLHLGGTFEEIVAAEAATTRGEHVERPFALVSQPHVADPSRRADGHVPLWVYAHVPNGSSADASQLIDAQIERFAPGFRERVRARRVTTPDDFEAWNPNFVGGDIAGGASTGLQLIARPGMTLDPYSTGVPGIFLCSASTPPGAGVHGMCGYNAARRALRILTA